MSWLLARLLFLPTLAWNAALRRLRPARRWWDQVDEHVWIGALPFPGDAEALFAAGIRAVVNTCEEYRGPREQYRRLGIEQLHIPTVDFCVPRLEDIERAVTFMDAHTRRGNQVYVHCKAGRGRSATVVLCWLIFRGRLTPAEAQARLQAKRPHVVATIHQRPVVLEFAKRYGAPGQAGV